MNLVSKEPKGDNVITSPYLFYRLRGSKNNIKWVKIPVVEVYLRSSSVEYTSIALVDSGSDRTFIQKQEADLLKLQPVRDNSGNLVTSEAVGAGGKIPCKIMVLPELTLRSKARPFCTFLGRQVWVPDNEGTIPLSILGRDTVFKRFDITFREGKQTIIFRRI